MVVGWAFRVASEYPDRRTRFLVAKNWPKDGFASCVGNKIYVMSVGVSVHYCFTPGYFEIAMFKVPSINCMKNHFSGSFYSI